MISIFNLFKKDDARKGQHPILRVLYFSVLIAVVVAPISTRRVFAESLKNTVQIYIDGKTLNVATSATTVEGAILDTGHTLDVKDIVEPGLSTEITDGFKINVYRASLVTVKDRGFSAAIKTAQRTPEAIAKEAGRPMLPEDRAELRKTQLSAEDLNPGGVLEIDRADRVKFNLYGVVSEYRTQAETVQQFLDQNKISLQPGDSLVQNPADKISDGSEVTIQNDAKEVVVVEEEIVMPVETIKDINKDTDYKMIQTAGSAGSKSVTYEIAKQNGKEISRTKVNEVVIKEAVKQVVVVGAKVAVAPAPVGGSLTEWMAQAGIAQSDWGYASSIIARESGGNYLAQNRSSGAYGLCQALPGTKMATAGADWRTNPVTQLRWCSSYAHSRYGSWAASYTFWKSHHWW